MLAETFESMGVNATQRQEYGMPMFWIGAVILAIGLYQYNYGEAGDKTNYIIGGGGLVALVGYAMAGWGILGAEYRGF